MYYERGGTLRTFLTLRVGLVRNTRSAHSTRLYQLLVQQTLSLQWPVDTSTTPFPLPFNCAPSDSARNLLLNPHASMSSKGVKTVFYFIRFNPPPQVALYLPLRLAKPYPLQGWSGLTAGMKCECEARKCRLTCRRAPLEPPLAEPNCLLTLSGHP